VARIRGELDRLGRPGDVVDGGAGRGGAATGARGSPSGPQRPRNPELVAPDIIEFEPLRIDPR
jgi:hypothetical protein